MPRKLWLIALLPIAAVVAYRRMHGAKLGDLAGNFHTYSMPDAHLYDAVVGRIASRFYSSVAIEMAATQPSGSVLEVGSGPGRLAVALGVAAPGLKITGLDVAPDMVEIANRRAEEAGVADRVRFEIGDVGSMSYGDGQFDLVVSTFSLHHWPDPRRGLAEIQRVLKPGGTVCIYDMSAGTLGLLHHGGDTHTLEAASESLPGATLEPVWSIGPLKLIDRLRWTR